MKNYMTVLAGIWIGVALCIPLARHITIPPMPWPLAIKLPLLCGLVSTPVLMLATWCAESANKAHARAWQQWRDTHPIDPRC